MRHLKSIEAVKKLIAAGKLLTLSGSEAALSQLPKGNWIGSTIPHFMKRENEILNQDDIFVNEADKRVKDFKIISYDETTINTLTKDRFENGYTVLIIPPFQKIHSSFSLNASNYDGIYDSPLIGWVSGIGLNSKDAPKTFNGFTGVKQTSQGVAMHVQLPKNVIGRVETVNIHKEEADSETFEFSEDAFQVTNCLINGKEENLAEYLTSNNIDIKAPLISDFSGAKINVSFKEINIKKGTVCFYAPVFKGKKYVRASSIVDYKKGFIQAAPRLDHPEEYACNCILNYLYGGLEKTDIGMEGPITFGEIGYILLNQTLTYLMLEEI